MTVAEDTTLGLRGMLAAARVLRAVNLTPARIGREGWRAAVLDGLRQGQADSSRRAAGPLSESLALLWEQRKARAEQERARMQPAELAALEAQRTRADEAHESECSRCGGARFVRLTADRGDPRFGRVVPCECLPLAARAALAGIPTRFRETTLGTFPRLEGKAEALDFARRWDGETSLVITGATYGSGKTGLGCALLLSRLDRGEPARFVYVADLLDEIRARYGDGSEEQATAYADHVASEPLLMLDDLGAERGTEWALERLRILIDRRHRQRLPTIVTTNYETPQQIADAFGGAIASRLADRETFTWLRLAGVDLRQRAP